MMKRPFASQPYKTVRNTVELYDESMAGNSAFCYTDYSSKRTKKYTILRKGFSNTL